MNYAQIRKHDIANGPGIRSSLFVSGCTHNCPGCFNTDYKKFNYGEIWDEEIEETFINYIKEPIIKGVTILGGEPMDQLRDDDLLNLLIRIKDETKKNIWLYSGYTYEQILAHKKRKKILELTDVLVDGLYVQELKDLRLKFRGSSNQRIIDVKKSLETGLVNMLEGYE